MHILKIQFKGPEIMQLLIRFFPQSGQKAGSRLKDDT